MGILIAFPWAAFAVAAAFACLWRWRGGRSTAAAALAWTAYGAYECLVYARVLCSGECNIRVDLLLVYPLLLFLTIAAVVAIVRRRPAPPRA